MSSIYDEYERLKKTPIKDIILNGNFGFSEKKEKGKEVLTNGDTNILVGYRNPSSGHYLYTDVDDNTNKGTIVHFCKKYGYDIKDLFKINIFTQKTANNYDPQPKQKKPTTPKEILAKLNRWWHDKRNNYLLYRGLSNEIINQYINLKGLKAPQPRTNAYGLYCPLIINLNTNLDGDFTGMSKHNAPTSFDKYKQRCLGIPKGFLILKKNNDFKKIYICESPIDALSLEQLYIHHGDLINRAYIVTCGTLSQKCLAELKDLIPILPPTILAFDNDSEGQGRELADKIQGLLSVKIPEKFPKTVKDWNDELNYLLSQK